MFRPVETTLDVLLLDPTKVPPKNARYGEHVKGFVASRIFDFDGKPWQLRSFKIVKSLKLFCPFYFASELLYFICTLLWSIPVDPLGTDLFLVAPFLHDMVGASCSSFVICCSGWDRSIIQSHTTDKLFQVLNPLGRIADPLSNDWDLAHKKLLEQNDIRFTVWHFSFFSLCRFSMNLFGHELAKSIIDCDTAGDVF